MNGFYKAPYACRGCTITTWIDHGEWLKTSLANYEVCDDVVPFLRRLTAEVAKRGIQVYFFLSPFDIWILYPHYTENHWARVEETKRHLAGLGNVYDFIRYNALTDERLVPNMRYWSDTIHFSPELGPLMVGALIDRSKVDMPDKLGQ